MIAKGTETRVEGQIRVIDLPLVRKACYGMS